MSQTRVSGGNQTHENHTNSLAHYPLNYQGTHISLSSLCYSKIESKKNQKKHFLNLEFKFFGLALD